MRILIVYPYVPFPLTRGTYRRVFNLARELGERHEVDLFCLDGARSGEHRGVFERFAERVHFQPFQNPPWPRFFPDRLLDPTPASIAHWWDPQAAEALQAFADGQNYDLVHFCDLVMWQYVSALPSPAVRVMDRTRVDLLFQREGLAKLKHGWMENLLRRENLWKLHRYEKETAAQLAATVVGGQDDATFLLCEVPAAARVKVLPNGLDAHLLQHESFPARPDPDPTILFCGAMDYSPNVTGVMWFFENCDAEVRRRVPNRRVLIVGKNPAQHVRALGGIEGVTVTGGVDDVRPYYQRAWLQTVPLLIGGGTRLKIVESLALGMPVVSTTAGAHGLDLEDGRHLLLAHGPDEFAGAVVRMLGDTALRGRLAENGRDRILQRYTWERLGGELSRFYEELVADGKPATNGELVAK